MCGEVLKVWTRNAQGGVILNCGSVLTQRLQRDYFATVGYAASKGAIEAMSRSATAYYARAGIHINVIAPGLARTPMSARAQADPHITEYMTHKQPLSKGMLNPEAIARAARFLLSSDSSPMREQSVTVDGGWTVSE